MAKKKRTAPSRKKKLAPAQKKRSGRALQVVREPRSGTLDSTLDPMLNSVPEREPPTENPEALPEARGALSGDLQGLETDEDEENESVAELVEEGQDLEAEEVEAIENAPDPDTGALKPRKVPKPVQPNDFKDRNRM